MIHTRRLIVNADDFGQSRGVNAGVIRAHDDGILTSASLMVRWPAASHAAEVALWRPELSIGLHVDLGEWRLAGNEWVPVYEVVPLAGADEVRSEIARQLTAFRELLGRDPSHLDSHQHVHRLESIRSVLMELASELQIPLRHCTPGVRHCGDFYGHDELGMHRAGALSAVQLINLLAALPPGVTELACHPAAVTDLATMYRHERLLELQSLCDERVKQSIRSLGIELCSFNDLSGERWEPALVGGAS